DYAVFQGLMVAAYKGAVSRKATTNPRATAIATMYPSGVGNPVRRFGQTPPAAHNAARHPRRRAARDLEIGPAGHRRRCPAGPCACPAAVPGCRTAARPT